MTIIVLKETRIYFISAMLSFNAKSDNTIKYLTSKKRG